MENSIEKSVLIERIYRDFAEVPYPGDNASGFEGNDEKKCRRHEPYEVKKFFAGKTWQSINLKSLAEDYPSPQQDCLAFMVPAAFRYYLPGFMIIIITDYEECDLICEYVIDFCYYNINDKIMKNIFHQRFDVYNFDQKQCVALFLKYIYNNHLNDYSCSDQNSSTLVSVFHPLVSLNSYWYKFLPRPDLSN